MNTSDKLTNDRTRQLSGEIHNLRKERDGAAMVAPDMVPNLERLLILRQYELYAVETNTPWNDTFGKNAIDLSAKLFEDVCGQMERRENTTAYGEPQAFISLDNGRSVEITFEQEGLPEDEQFYSIRLHCSTEEYEKNFYKATVGVITSFETDGPVLDEVRDCILCIMLEDAITPIGRAPIKEQAPKSKEYAASLSNFLSTFDFSYDVYENNNAYENPRRLRLIEDGDLEAKYLHEPLIGLIDQQGANFGDIESQRFPMDENLVANIISRMDTYIQDGVVSEFVDTMEENGFDSSRLTLREMYYIAKGLGVTDVSYDMADLIMHPEKIFVPELEHKEGIDKQLLMLVNEMTRNAWTGKGPTLTRLSDGVNTIEVEGYVYEPRYEDFSSTASISLNGKVLYGIDSRSADSYRTEVYQKGTFATMEDAITHIKGVCKANILSPVSDKKPSFELQLNAAAARASSQSTQAPKEPSRDNER